MAARGSEPNHERLWAAIDTVAARVGLSPSALAVKAGLNRTTFNRSKRTTGDGRPRWPSTESIAKILAATGFGLDDFVDLILARRPRTAPVALPVVAPHPTGGVGFAESTPTGLAFPGPHPEALIAFTVASADEPAGYLPGDVLIASTAVRPRRGDRALVATTDGRVAIRIFLRRRGRGAEFADRDTGGRPVRMADVDVLWIARILWVSQ